MRACSRTGLRGDAKLEIACKLDPDGRGQRQHLLIDLVARASERRESKDGYTFGFPSTATTMVETASTVEPERHCCPFLRLTVIAEPGDGPIWLELTGPAGTKDFLRGLPNIP